MRTYNKQVVGITNIKSEKTTLLIDKLPLNM